MLVLVLVLLLLLAGTYGRLSCLCPSSRAEQLQCCRLLCTAHLEAA